MDIIWENYIWDKAIPAPKNDIHDTEKKLGITFPVDYKKTVMIHHGQSPSPSCFNANKVVDVFSSLYHFNESESKSSNILWNYSATREFLPEKIIPFADTPGGDFICFDYRDGAAKIVYASHEKSGEAAIIPIANSFSEFLDKLYDPDEE